MNGIEWKDIVGYEGLYQISNHGDVKSFEKVRKTGGGGIRIYPEIIMKPGLDTNGYKRIGFCKNGNKSTYKVHRLVANAFIPNPNNLPQVNHKDENKTNNHVDNLEWCTHKYNVNYGSRNKLAGESISSFLKQYGSKRCKKVFQYDLDGNLINTYSSIAECKQYGFNEGNIASCCTGKRKTADGYIWKH